MTDAAPLSRALQSARVAFFDYAPDRLRDPRDLAGTL